MEIPCFLTFFAEEKWLNKISKLIEDLCFSDDKTEEREDGKSEKNGAEDEITEYEPVKKQAKMVSEQATIVLVESPADGEVETASNVWVQCGTCSLSFRDKEIIETGMELTDQHMQYSQHLVKMQFSSIGGLCSTLLQNKSHNLPQNSVQVVFCNSRHHWIVVSNMNCNKGMVNVYDSLFKVLDEETVDTINNYFMIESKKKHKVKCNMMDVQIQKGSKDYGVFSIAFLTSLVYNEDPSQIVYYQDQMRLHLLDCFTKGRLVPFPRI